MSARNGDKSRFGRQRKQKIQRRVVLRALRPAPAPETEAASQAPAEGTAAPAQGNEAEGVLAGAARKLGSVLGTIAVETHLATPPSEHQE